MTLPYADTHAPSGDMVWSTSLVVSSHVIAESASATMVHGEKKQRLQVEKSTLP
jgi:hypothetical protein